MSDIIKAAGVGVHLSKPGCQGRCVRLMLLDSDGAPFAMASMSPQVAREIAADLEDQADITEARTLAKAGRLA